MITLKDLVRSDRAVASVTTDECHLIAAVLDSVARSWLARWFLPRKLRTKANVLSLRMLAATLSRTQPEAAPSLQRQIQLRMEADRG